MRVRQGMGLPKEVPKEVLELIENTRLEMENECELKISIDEDGDVVVRLAHPPKGWHVVAHGATIAEAVERYQEMHKIAMFDIKYPPYRKEGE